MVVLTLPVKSLKTNSLLLIGELLVRVLSINQANEYFAILIVRLDADIGIGIFAIAERRLVQFFRVRVVVLIERLLKLPVPVRVVQMLRVRLKICSFTKSVKVQ